jgi:hypothetical protein
MPAPVNIPAEDTSMKLLTSLAFTITLVASVLAQTPTRTATEAQVREQLDEAARVFREGNFAQAQVHSERALQLDPQNKTAPFFVARSIHAQYKPGDSKPENIAIARKAIVAYQRILEREHADDEAYKAVAYLYGAMKEDELQRQWTLQRAVDVSIADDKRAEAYVVLASKEWDCSFNITEQPNIKIATTRKNKSYVRYRMPKDRAEFDRASACANRGLEFVNTAIVLAPEDETAWSYKTNLFLELSKLAEMSRDFPQQREFLRQYEEALKQTTTLSNRATAKP